MNTHRRTTVGFVLAALVLWPQAPTTGQQLPGPHTRWSLAATGDVIMTRRILQFDNAGDPRFQAMTRVIRDADAAFLNLELSLFQLEGFDGWPAAEHGGNWERGPRAAALDLQAMGFDLFNRANNHTTDYGVAGLRATNKLLDELGIAHSGSGENLGWASRPAYLDTPKGRIALIGLATSFTPMSRAGAARPEVMGRPGLNALRVEQRHEADPATFAMLNAAAPALGGRAAAEAGAPVRILGTTVWPGEETRVVESLNQADMDRILREVRNAAGLADYVIVNSHSHQPGNASLVPPPWLEEFAKKCLDAGAVAYIVHGPHQLRGIEIYDGKPIFYSLANFIFQNETIDPMPSDNYERYGLTDTTLAAGLYEERFQGGTTGFPSRPVWYESVVAVPTFEGNQLVDLKLYPIDLGQTAPRSQRGTPRLATEETGRKIIDRLARLSAPFGTTIVYEDGVGVWRPGASRTSGGGGRR